MGGPPKWQNSNSEAVPILPNLGVGNQPRFAIQLLKPYKNRGFPLSSGSRLEPLGQGKTDFRDSLSELVTVHRVLAAAKPPMQCHGRGPLVVPVAGPDKQVPPAL